jgi:hypothetical protein
VEKKKKGRVLDAKAVTQLNSVRVSFVNRKGNRGYLAKAPAVRGLHHGPRWVLCMRTGGTPGWAKLLLAGRAVNSFSNFPVNYKCLFNIVFS